MKAGVAALLPQSGEEMSRESEKARGGDFAKSRAFKSNCSSRKHFSGLQNVFG